MASPAVQLNRLRESRERAARAGRDLRVSARAFWRLRPACPDRPQAAPEPPPASRRQPHRSGGRLTRQTAARSEEHTSELQSQSNLVCRLLLEKKNNTDSI